MTPDPVQQEAEQAWEAGPGVGISAYLDAVREARGEPDRDLIDRGEAVHRSFVAGFETAAESRDQRIRELMPYVQHQPDCRSNTPAAGWAHGSRYKAGPCSCALATLSRRE